MTDLPEPPTDLTALMSLDPLDLTKQDLDKIIAYQRKQRMTREAGGRTKKATGEAPAVDIKALLGKIQKPAAAPLSKTSQQIKDVGLTPPPPGKGFIRRL